MDLWVITKGVLIKKIERVIFCFTSRLDAEQENELAEVSEEKGVSLGLFGLDAIAFDSSWTMRTA